MKRQSKGTLIQVVLSDADIAELDLICDEIAAKRPYYLKVETYA